MANADAVKSKIQNLIATANETTGKSDGDMTTAIASLIAGFGGGGSSSAMVGGTYRVEERPLGQVLTFEIPESAEYFLFTIAEEPDITTSKPFMGLVFGIRSLGMTISCGSNTTGSALSVAACFKVGANSSYYYGAYFDGPSVSMYPTDTSSQNRRTPQPGKNYVWWAW